MNKNNLLNYKHQCIDCGSDILGDGFTIIYHCEYVEDLESFEPDAGTLYCGFGHSGEPRLI